jgi:hypothetical protein
MLLVDKLNKGKLPEKPEKGDSTPPGLSSLVVKPQNVAARIRMLTPSRGSSTSA